MSILNLEFADIQRPWHLKPVAFDDFNLLVGLSGVGKTRTLGVLSDLGRAARGHTHDLAGCRWTVQVATPAGKFTWTARTETESASGRANDDEDDLGIRVPRSERPVFLEEEVRNEEGALLAQRSAEELTLNGKAIPRLRAKDSIVSLIDEEPIIHVREALGAIHMCRAVADRPPIFDRVKLDRLLAGTESLDALKADRKTDLVSKAYALKLRFPKEFEKVQERLIEIFDTVVELDVGELTKFDPKPRLEAPLDFLVPAFREKGVDGWVNGFDMSNGMRRTLLHLLELHLEPPGSVLLIDEYENGMGVNCLPQVTQTLFERSGEVQLIFTSHHPHVINNVSKDLWRVMRRNGHEVEVLRKADIARLNTTSEIDSFIQLVNAPEFTGGIT